MKKLIAIILALFGVNRFSWAAPEKTPGVFDWHIDVLAAVLWAEARGEGPIGVRAVAEVIKNRSDFHHKSTYRVVVDGKQFSCLDKTPPSELIKKAKASKGDDLKLWYFCHTIATALFNGTFKGANLTHGAMFYHSRNVRPLWAEDMFCTARIGNHIFYVSSSREFMP
jgi:spore germination cell wall hydrolase CwlJ-like protein